MLGPWVVWGILGRGEGSCRQVTFSTVPSVMFLQVHPHPPTPGPWLIFRLRVSSV